MIRRSGITLLNSVSKQFRNTSREPALLSVQYERPPQLVLPGKPDEYKAFHSASSMLQTIRLGSADLHPHGESDQILWILKRAASTDAKAESAAEETPTGEAGEVTITREVRDPEKDRTKIIPVETSMRYIKSSAYKETYGDTPVWVLYKRNFKGQYAPKRTRRTCIRKGMLSTGNPCPICRDEYLVLDYRNVDLLKQFISPFNGQILGWDKTGLCRTKHFELTVAITKAKDYGTITFDTKFREYNYEDYYPKEVCQTLFPHSH